MCIDLLKHLKLLQLMQLLQFINHTGRWLKFLYRITSVMDQDEPS
jgi:hypothetical protein